MFAENQTTNIWNSFVSVRFSGGIGSSLWSEERRVVNKAKILFKLMARYPLVSTPQRVRKKVTLAKCL